MLLILWSPYYYLVLKQEGPETVGSTAIGNYQLGNIRVSSGIDVYSLINPYFYITGYFGYLF